MTLTLPAPPYLDRVLADSADRATWLVGREDVIGASDAAGFAKPESVPLYVRAKLKSGRFTGNRYTESGNLWEPRMLDWFGVPQNTLLIHADGDRDSAATPDGIEVTRSGEVILAECKAIHGRIVKGPSLAFLRQMWWAQYCLGATRTKFIWQQLNDDGIPDRLEPHITIVDRDDREISKLLAIARPVLRGVREARAFMKEMEA